MPRIAQIKSSYCGPAVVQMLLGNLGYKSDQKELADVADEEEGTTIFDLLKAVKTLYPQTKFWYKDNSTIEDLKELVEEKNVPVGVEWQGIFGKYSDNDDSHYSIVTHIEDWDSSIHIADPYHRFPREDRIFRLNNFEERWWDYNNFKDPITNRWKSIKDYHMMFIITDKDETFPRRLGMVTV